MTSSPSIGIFLGRPDRGARLAAKLRERGFSVVHYNHQGFDGEPYVPVDPRALGAVAHVLLRTDHDVYLTGLSYIPVLSLYVNRALRRKPYVFNETALTWKSFRDRSKGKPFPLLFEHVVHPFLLRRTYAGATRIVCNSHFLAKRVAAHYPAFCGRVTTIYNGIDVDRYANARTTRSSGDRPRAVLLACVTTLDLDQKSRGLDVVLDTFGRVHARRPETRLAIAAKFSDPAYLDRFYRTLADRPWRDSVVVYPNHPRVENLLAGADVFVYATPSGSDSLPRALLEAQAAGVPAAATDTCGCSEAVAHEETGLLAPYDAAALSESVLRLVDGPHLRRGMGEAAHERTKRVFSWDAMADSYARLFETIAR
jgi:glycosyltransferase involved in cell wall biosynthesis